ncbi:hypothetical protein BKA70DRAFT_1530026 [Coprinopsis sp. MPI-PUGE-AT-0042]|nr:hypothetical protein BKA70DRAFT_1530026 [Coprinopsis sp. MPI-PUGE-AT-0042]
MTLNITQLPPELLLEIFTWYLQPPLDNPGRDRFMLLRSVCSTWRALSFSTPELWANLSVDTGDAIEDAFVNNLASYSPSGSSFSEGSQLGHVRRTVTHNHSRLPSRIRAWFARASASTPLTLRITDHVVDYDVFRLQTLLQIACEPRVWLELDIGIPIDVEQVGEDNDVLWRVQANVDPKPWKDLSRLSMVCKTAKRNNSSFLPEGLIPLDTCAPVLQELKLQVGSKNVSFPRPHGNISILHLRLLDANIGFLAREVVGKLPNLCRLSVVGRMCARWRMWPAIEIPFDDGDASPIGSAITGTCPLNNTTSDTIEQVELDGDGIYILNYLCLPRLRRLIVRNSESTKGAVAILVDFIHRSKCDQTLEVIDLREHVDYALLREDVLDDLKQRLGMTLAGRIKLQA